MHKINLGNNRPLISRGTLGCCSPGLWGYCWVQALALLFNKTVDNHSHFGERVFILLVFLVFYLPINSQETL